MRGGGGTRSVCAGRCGVRDASRRALKVGQANGDEVALEGGAQLGHPRLEVVERRPVEPLQRRVAGGEGALVRLRLRLERRELRQLLRLAAAAARRRRRRGRRRRGRRRARRRRVAAVGVGRRQQRERQLELSGVERAAVVVEEPRARLGDDARRARARRADEPQRHRRVGREVAVVGAEAQPLVPPQLRARRVARPLGLADRPAVRVQLAPHLDVGRRHAGARLDERRVREARVGRRAVHRADADFDGQRDVAREEVGVGRGRRFAG